MLVPARRPCQMKKASFMAAQIVSISQLRASIQENLLVWDWMKQKMARSSTAARKQRLTSQKTSAMSQKPPWGTEGTLATLAKLACLQSVQLLTYFSIKDFFRLLVEFCTNAFHIIFPVVCPQSDSLLTYCSGTSYIHHRIIWFFMYSLNKHILSVSLFTHFLVISWVPITGKNGSGFRRCIQQALYSGAFPTRWTPY